MVTRDQFVISSEAIQSSFTEVGDRPLLQTRGTVALQYFPLGRHKNDRLNMQQLVLKRKTPFEKNKLSIEILMEKLKPIKGIKKNKKRIFSV